MIEFIQRRRLDFYSMKMRLGYSIAEHTEISAVFTAVDVPAPPAKLVDLALRGAGEALALRLSPTDDPWKGRKNVPESVNLWPGEHYRLLAALCKVLKVKRVVEIGTAAGVSALAMLPYIPADGSLVTFDVVPWDKFPDTCLIGADFTSPRFRQEIADLADLAVAKRYANELCDADLIFVDAAKDGIMEQKFLDNFQTLGLKQGVILVFDDIRLWNMLAIWRGIKKDKVDLTSFGHWTGTGLVAWNPL